MRQGGLIAVLAIATTIAAASAQGESAFEIIDGGIPDPLTDEPGNRFRGELIVRDAANASCLICHRMPIPDEPNPGNIGPDLAGIGARYTAAELRLRLVDPKVINPATAMPSYFSLRNLNRVEEQYVGQTIYSAQDIEDVVAFLLTMTDP